MEKKYQFPESTKWKNEPKNGVGTRKRDSMYIGKQNFHSNESKSKTLEFFFPREAFD